MTYPHDSDGDGVADVCSLPRTRRAAAARQNALERLGDNQPDRLQMLFPEECSKVPATFGETKAETTDECATGRLLTRFDQLANQLESLTISQMNNIRSAAPTLPTLQADDNLSAIAQAHAQAMADAQSYRTQFHFWKHLEPDWDFWSIGKSASITGDLYTPRVPGELSSALLGEQGSRLPVCSPCTHLATGIATAADGTAYVTAIMAGRDTGRQLTEAEQAAAESEMTDLVNELRASLGLNTLTYNPGVAAAARRWSQIMGARFDFNHNPYAGADYPTGYRSTERTSPSTSSPPRPPKQYTNPSATSSTAHSTTPPWSTQKPPTSASASSSKPDGYGSPKTTQFTLSGRNHHCGSDKRTNTTLPLTCTSESTAAVMRPSPSHPARQPQWPWRTCLSFPLLAGHLFYAAWFSRCRWCSSHSVGVW